MKFETSRFGTLEVDEDKILNFPDGLIGLPEIVNFVLIDHKDTPLKWLQSVDCPEIAFIVAAPEYIIDAYNVDIDSKVKKYLQLDREEDLAILLTLRVDGNDVIANSQGPILINADLRKGVQVVLENAGQSIQKTF
jgi:flagellar assembly factor FliW